MTQAVAPLPTEPAPAEGVLGLAPEAYGALLASRICHDLISPVGAIGNGAELLRELDRPSGAEMELIGRSAEMASANLQFLRIAFGAAPPGDVMGWPAVRRAARNWFEFQRPDLDWPETPGETTRAAARVVFNLMQAAVSALPRGGIVRLAVTAPGDRVEAELTGEGPAIRPAEGAQDWLRGIRGDEAPGPREVHYAAAALHARALGAPLQAEFGEDRLRLAVTLPAGI